MRIGVNALALTPNRIGGLENYLRRLLEALLRHTGDRFIVFTSSAAAETFQALPGRLDVRRLDADVADPALTRALAEEAVDLWWCPWVDWRPFRPGVPLVVTVPDLQHEHLPEMFAPEELALRRSAYFSAAHAASAVMTFSAHARQDLCTRYGVAPECVHAIPLAEGFDWDASEPRPERLTQLRASSGKGFLYYPANAWPHKDHATLLAAVRRLVERGRTVRVVLTGHFGAAQAELAAAVRRLGLHDQVSLRGFVEPADVRALYQLSGAVVVPSRFEGFGFPILEAMRAGTPVICAEATSLPELGADAVLYFRPGDPDALAGLVETLLDDPALRADLIRRGLERARAFSWEHTAARVAEVWAVAGTTARPETPTARAVDGLARRLSKSAQALERTCAESAERLHALECLTAESAARLDTIERLTAESAARLDAIERLTAESAARLDVLRRVTVESASRLAVIDGLVAALRGLDAAAEEAYPRAWHGLSPPREIRRVRQVIERMRERLQQLVSAPRGPSST